jgi:hypothetical protein
MSSPTVRASNVWQTEAADDMLQISNPRGPVISGIDSTGAGFGALAGGGMPGGTTGAIQFNSGTGFTNANGISAGSTALISSEGNFIVQSVGHFSFISTGNTMSLEAAQDIDISSDGGNISLDANETAQITAENGGVSLTASNGFIAFTSLSYSFDLGGVQAFANNAAAIAGGLSAGNIYRTSADPSVLCIVF